jgi:Glycosyl hydrolase family 65, N-terminal domain
MAKPDQESNDWVWVRAPSEADTAGPHWPSEPESDSLAETERPLKVVFLKPAKYWTDAAPIGNGRLGAMVWGGVTKEKLQLNGMCLRSLSLPPLKITTIFSVSKFHCEGPTIQRGKGNHLVLQSRALSHRHTHARTLSICNAQLYALLSSSFPSLL